MVDLLIVAFLPIVCQMMTVGAIIGFVMAIIGKLSNMLYKACFRGELVV